MWIDEEYRDEVTLPAPAAKAPTKTTAASKLNASLQTVGLNLRECVLVHCYRGAPPILRGQPGYDDYIKYGRTTDRIRYPDESKRKAKLLIKSIEKTFPFLTETQIKQAENEVNTIKDNFQNQL